MRLSYLIYSRDRRRTLLHTLSLLPSVTPLPTAEWETLIIPLSASDAAAQAARQEFPQIRLVDPAERALPPARGSLVVLLDDCTHPADGRTILAAQSYMNTNPAAGAAGGKIVLPGGAIRSAPLPSVVLGGATCLRKNALDRLGAIPRDLSGEAGDYDLSFRLWNSGAGVERRQELVFHQESLDEEDPPCHGPGEIRDRLIAVARFLPGKLRRIYWQDWDMRYRALAAHDGHRRGVARAALAARLHVWRHLRKPIPVSAEAIEGVFGLRRQNALVGEWARRNSVWRVVLGDFSDNTWATYNACRSNGLQMRCIADNDSAFEGMEYRGLPIVSASRAFEGGGIDGAILTNMNAGDIDARIKSLRRSFRGPILRLWEIPRLAAHATAA